uniref:Uncharacterized protein n=1 Tax=Cyanistes caeruleus TaxID=156563 RepID=A0A8C0UCS2_CYACU
FGIRRRNLGLPEGEIWGPGGEFGIGGEIWGQDGKFGIKRRNLGVLDGKFGFGRQNLGPGGEFRVKRKNLGTWMGNLGSGGEICDQEEKFGVLDGKFGKKILGVPGGGPIPSSGCGGGEGVSLCPLPDFLGVFGVFLGQVLTSKGDAWAKYLAEVQK